MACASADTNDSAVTIGDDASSVIDPDARGDANADLGVRCG